MSLKIRFRFDGRCNLHARYNPGTDGQPQHKDCAGCDALWVIHMYVRIARKKAAKGGGLLIRGPAQELEEDTSDQGVGDTSS